MPKDISWEEVVAAARDRRINRLDVRSLERAILERDALVRASEGLEDNGAPDDTGDTPSAAEKPARKRKGGANA